MACDIIQYGIGRSLLPCIASSTASCTTAAPSLLRCFRSPPVSLKILVLTSSGWVEGTTSALRSAVYWILELHNFQEIFSEKLPRSFLLSIMLFGDNAKESVPYDVVCVSGI